MHFGEIIKVLKNILCWIITARIRRMREGNSFSLCVSSDLGGGGTRPGPHPGQIPRCWGGGVYLPHPTPSSRSDPRKGGGVPLLEQLIACTCYAAGGMPLAFTQEDFLVKNSVKTLQVNNFRTYQQTRSWSCSCGVDLACSWWWR